MTWTPGSVRSWAICGRIGSSATSCERTSPRGPGPTAPSSSRYRRDEFDADILLHLQDVAGWSREPRRYIDEAYQAFRRGSRYRDVVERKNRCVRIHYANLCHVDVVPYLLRGFFGQKVIVNGAENRFEPTDPERFAAWMQRQDGRANGNLRKTIRGNYG